MERVESPRVWEILNLATFETLEPAVIQKGVLS